MATINAPAPRRPRPTVAQSLTSQMRFLPLDLTPGPNGYRSAHTGGTAYLVAGEFKTAEQAFAANRQAVAMTGRLMGELFPKARA